MDILRRRALCLFPSLVLASATASCDRRAVSEVAPAKTLEADASVLVVGDSLTFGYGAAPESAWPAVLGRLTGWQVINLGLNGDTTESALPRLREFISERAGTSKPNVDAVIIALGGNDMLRRVEDESIKRNLGALLSTAKSSVKHGSSHVALLAAPRPTIAAAAGFSLTDADFYKAVSKREGVLLLREIYSEVLADESLRSDQIHANGKGYAVIAAGVRDGLRNAGWLPKSA